MTVERGASAGERPSWFVRSVPRHPGRFIPPRAEPEAPGPDESVFARRMPVEPGVFSVGLEAFAEVEDHARRAGLPPLPAVDFDSAPFDVERYLGRVEEISASGTVIATLWEVPSGRHGTAAFESDTRFQPEAPRVGALVHVWAWSERSDDGEVKTKNLVRVENRVLTEEERAEFRALLKATEGEGP